MARFFSVSLAFCAAVDPLNSLRAPSTASSEKSVTPKDSVVFGPAPTALRPVH